jgi:hypothetical protein
MLADIDELDKHKYVRKVAPPTVPSEQLSESVIDPNDAVTNLTEVTFPASQKYRYPPREEHSSDSSSDDSSNSPLWADRVIHNEYNYANAIDRYTFLPHFPSVKFPSKSRKPSMYPQRRRFNPHEMFKSLKIILNQSQNQQSTSRMRVTWLRG